MRSLNMEKKDYGDGQRLSFQENELKNAPITPNPIEYEDIDKAFYDFFKDNVKLVDENGKSFGTYTFFSSQRFSEFSQTWGHDDADGNLLMNFFTITRENNPNWGNLQGGSYNIPGDNRFTVSMREILDDTGVECYEITSMSQPIQVDVNYRYSLVTGKFKYLNDFNQRVNKLFESKQCYLCVNGHYMPMTLENVSDVSDYSIDGRKFYSQSMDIVLMAYIIPKDDIKINIVPKRKKVATNLKKYDRTIVTMDYDDDSEKDFTLNIKFNKNVSKVNFSLDEKMELLFIDKQNADKINMKINDDGVDVYSRLEINPGDNLFIKFVKPVNIKSSEILFKGHLI